MRAICLRRPPGGACSNIDMEAEIHIGSNPLEFLFERETVEIEVDPNNDRQRAVICGTTARGRSFETILPAKWDLLPLVGKVVLRRGVASEGSEDREEIRGLLKEIIVRATEGAYWRHPMRVVFPSDDKNPLESGFFWETVRRLNPEGRGWSMTGSTVYVHSWEGGESRPLEEMPFWHERPCASA